MSDIGTSGGTATFLFSDIEGSTKLLQESGGAAYGRILEDVRKILRETLNTFGGREIDTAGDGLFAAFASARDAVAAALQAQSILAAHSWPENKTVRVRMGIHTGEPMTTQQGYVGLDVHRAARICSAGHGGQILLSSATHKLIENDPPPGVTLRDLGEHQLKDIHRPEGIFQVSGEGMPVDFPPLQAVRGRRTNLPMNLVRLIGRDREVEQVVHLLLQREVRLVSLTGPGGTGKTSLAVNVASLLVDEFRDGVIFVSLVPLNDPSLVTPTICQALGFQTSRSDSMSEALTYFLEPKTLLLVLDNFEQVVTAASVVDGLLVSCPKLKILVTSRIVLHVRGEREYPVPPLSLPARTQIPSLEVMSQYAAVALFIQRATAVRPDFVVTNENAPAVAEICDRLDGLPLAIELAAARIKLFTPQALLARLGSRLDLLKTSSQHIHARHQTLRSAIDWSYQLLTDPEKTLFRQLAVFVGGWTLEAAEEIHGRSADDLDVIDGLSALIDKSLVRREDQPGGEARFTMLETIHEYALERLASGEDSEQVHQAHAEHFCRLALQAELHLTGPEQRRWLDLLQAEHDNMRAALNWAEKQNLGQLALRISGALWRFWIVRGFMVEGERKLQDVLAIPSASERSADRAKVLNGLGTIKHELSHYGSARPILEESLAIWREVGDKAGVATALNNLGWVAMFLGDYALCRSLSEEALAIHRESGNKRGVALSLNNLGWTATFECEFLKAKQLLEQSLKIRKELGDPRGTAFLQLNLSWPEYKLGESERALSMVREALDVLRSLADRQITSWGLLTTGIILEDRGEYADALVPLEESIATMKEIGNLWGVSFELGILGRVLCHVGRLEEGRSFLEEAYQQARETESPIVITLSSYQLGSLYGSLKNTDKAFEFYRESLLWSTTLSDRVTSAQSLVGLAEIAADLGQLETAGLLCGAADTMCTSCGGHLPAWERNTYDRLTATVRTSRGEEPLSRGATLSADDAVQIALNIISEKEPRA